MTGRVSILLLLLAISLGAAPAGCVGRREPAKKPGSESAPPTARTLRVFCATGIRPPVLLIADAFKQAHPGVEVRMQYGGSGALLGMLTTLKAEEYRPDIFIAGEDLYGNQAREQGLADEVLTMATFRPVVAVPRDNPLGIAKLDDLARPDVRVALGDAKTAIGGATDRLLNKAGLTVIRDNCRRGGSTVYEVANLLLPGQQGNASADAAIIWDATAVQGDFMGRFKLISIPQADDVRIVICRIADTPNRDLADDFIRLATAGQVAREAFTRFGYTAAELAPRSQP
ncbi:MAG: hypothetical protein BIFFINMI_01798 [Phycisphaerae bacterium]|nr:hypothetical protein [Phycisphaerae bacterium]